MRTLKPPRISLPSLEGHTEHLRIGRRAEYQARIARLHRQVLDLVAAEQVAGEDVHLPSVRAVADDGVGHVVTLDPGVARQAGVAVVAAARTAAGVKDQAAALADGQFVVEPQRTCPTRHTGQALARERAAGRGEALHN